MTKSAPLPSGPRGSTTVVTTLDKILGAANRSRMIVATEDGRIVMSVAYAPRGQTFTNNGRQWVQLDRPGRAPLLSENGPQLVVQTFDLYLGSKDSDVSCEPQIQLVKQLARTRTRLVISYGPMDGGLWRMTSCTVNAVNRTEDTNEITQATANVEFTQASDEQVQTGPVNGGHNSGNTNANLPLWYTVKKGDTLHKLSAKYYGTPKWWRYLADKNDIKKPKENGDLKPGKRLRIPKLIKSQGVG